MKDFYDLFATLLGFVKIPATGWTFAFFVIVFFLRQRISSWINNILDFFGRKISSQASSKRFEPTYRKYIRPGHLYMKIVGIRTEEEKRPSIIDAYIPLKLLLKGESIDNAISLGEAIQDHNYFVILGDPGSGKSTLLDYLITVYTEPLKKVRHMWNFLTFPFTRKPPLYCPIYVPLRRCTTKNKTLLADISDEETEILPPTIRENMPKHFIEHCVKGGWAVLLLDGLDEVTNEQAYRDATRKINEFTQLYPKNKVIVTCRKAGWRGDLSPDFQIHSVLPLDSQQQSQFISKWYNAVMQYLSRQASIEEQKIRKSSELEANHLLALLQTRERLSELASNPLLLSLICLVHKQRKDLPRGRANLYQDCLDILLDLWDRIDKEFDQQYPAKEQKKWLLRHVAYRMQTNGLREIDRKTLEVWTSELLPNMKAGMTATDIVRQIEVRGGVMVEHSIDKLTFSHLTFQEFLVVEHLLTEENGNILVDINIDWATWREPILLMCGMKLDPMPLLQQLHIQRPLLAISGIAEAEPIRLDLHLTQHIVDDTVKQIYKQSIELSEAIPALTNLLSIEGNPFGTSILKVIYTRIQACSIEQVSKIVVELSKIPTRESAKTLLSLLIQTDLSKMENIFIDGLARIGNNALYEALEWREDRRFSERQLFDILANCFTPLASTLLWSHYELDPPVDQKQVWAQSWALRLKDMEIRDQLRQLTPSTPNLTDNKAWPYQKNDGSVLAALTTKIFSVLHEKYEHYSDIVEDLDTFSHLALHLQIPLLVYSQKDIPNTKFLQEKLHLEVLPTEQDWFILSDDINDPMNSKAFAVSLLGSFVVAIVSAILTDIGIILLPNGSFLGFWIWLPLWARITLPLGMLAFSYIVYFISINIDCYSKNGTSPNSWSFITKDNVVASIVILLIGALLPLLWIFMYVGAYIDEHRTRSIQLLKLRKFDLVLILMILGTIIIATITDFLALRHWLTGILPSIFALIFISIITIIIYLFFAYIGNSGLKSFFIKYPNKSEVLEEISIQK